MLNTWRKYRDIMVKHSTKGRLGLVLVILIMLSACSATPKDVFIIVDGIPADVIESVDTPNLDVISNAGGYTRAYRVAKWVVRAKRRPFQPLVTTLF